jgi:hypothetical protein
MKPYCDTTRTYTETKLVDPEYYSCNIPAIEGNAETSSEIILTEGYSFQINSLELPELTIASMSIFENANHLSQGPSGMPQSGK